MQAAPPVNRTSYPIATLQHWMQAMDDYGQCWSQDIGDAYFSQEYWYLYTASLVGYWRDKPLSISTACQLMQTGSSKTRENRLQRLIDAGLLHKIKIGQNLRHTYLQPSKAVVTTGQQHFAKTLRKNVTMLAHNNLLDWEIDDQETTERQLQESPPLAWIILWAEFLITYTDDWNQTFQQRFRTDQYWHPFVYCLRGLWNNRPLNMTDICQAVPTGSARTKEKRIALAISRGMLDRQRSDDDQRTLLVHPAATLQTLLIEHFTRTLAKNQVLAHQMLTNTGANR